MLKSKTTKEPLTLTKCRRCKKEGALIRGRLREILVENLGLLKSYFIARFFFYNINI